MSDETVAPSGCLRIFLVENHRDTLTGLTRYLEQMGHTVSSAMTVEDAVASLGNTPIDVLISDIGLPDGTGWDLLERAKLPATVCTVAMSGFGMNADRIRSEAAGYRRHLLKPFDPKDLDDILAEITEQRASSAKGPY